jgi:hypothetical protein
MLTNPEEATRQARIREIKTLRATLQAAATWIATYGEIGAAKDIQQAALNKINQALNADH